MAVVGVEAPGGVEAHREEPSGALAVYVVGQSRRVGAPRLNSSKRPDTSWISLMVATPAQQPLHHAASMTG